uniref:Multifunctional methyltransferase subunit TRM112-like protein n=1 Tax=Heterorhabditis bacteriophora TaxID=37862 RepID=A0A1I7W7X0_HETBA
MYTLVVFYDLMKLLTHNFLSSRFLKNVNNGYPLIVRSNQKEIKDVEFNATFVKNMMPKVDYASLYFAAQSIDEAGKMPETLPEDWETNVTVLEELHRVMLCIEIIDGELECPDTGRKFPIKDGIPNLLVSENEV